MGLPRVAFVLALVASACFAAAPQTTGSYKIKRGQAAANEVTMAEFRVDFDQDLHLLEFQDCPGVPSGPCAPVNVSECPPCDYASKTACGTIRETRNRADQACIDKCAQNPSWCDPTTTFGPWEEINIGDTIVGRGPSAGGNPPFITYRLYVPEGQFCNFSIFIRQTTRAVMLNAGDLLISRTPLNATEAFLTNTRMPWLGSGSDVLNSDNIHVCPTDFSPVPGFYTDEAGAGTYFIILIGPQLFNLSVTKLPIAPPLPDEDMSWCDGSTLPEPFNVPVSVFAPAPGALVDDIFTDGEIHCIANDRLYEFYIDSGPFSTLVVLLARVDGPCPRMFGITQTDDNSAQFSEIYASTTIPYPGFSDLGDFGEPAVLVDHDFPKRSFVWSFCPNDTTKPTYIAISIWSGGPQRIFYSSNPARFRATRFDDVGAPQELAYVAQSAMTLKFPGGGLSPDCSMRCVYASTPCSCAFASGPMSPFTEPSPLWPYPRWYINILGRENIAQSFTPDYLQSLTFNATRSMYTSLLLTTTSFLENGTATKTYFTEEQVAQAYVGFYGQFSVVNANLEAPMPDFLSSFVPAPYKQTTLPCTNELYTTARASVDKVLPRLLNVSTDLSTTNTELDVLNFVDGFVGCLQKADALLIERNVTRLEASTGCLATDFISQTLLPCCNPESDWTECCLPTLANVSDISYALPPAESLLSQCQDPECLNTYLSDYLLQRETSCATALPRNSVWSLSLCYEPHVVCERAVYGDDLVGVTCVTDADCGPNGFCSELSLPGISLGNPYETYNRPRGLRRTCRVPRANLTEAYLNCLVAIRSPAMLQMLDAKYPAASYAQSVQLLLADPQFRTNACVASAGMAPEPGFGTYYKRGNLPIGSVCPQGTEQWSILPERSYVVIDYWRRGPVDFCGVFPDWFPIYTDQPTCEGRLTCNWLDCVAKNLTDSACVSSCLAPTGVCAICRNDGTCFDDFATIDASATDNTTCAASHACQLANGSIVALDPATCAQTFTCSRPCWNANTQAYEACATEAACLGAGECDDELFHNPLTGGDSSCVIGMSNRNSYFRQNCALMVGGELGYETVVGDTTGCVIWDILDPQECNSLDGQSNRLVNPVWHTRARTRLECEGLCGCVKDTTWHPTPQRPNITDTWPSSPAECAACTPSQECSPYHKWTQARWERGNPRTLRWIDAPAMVAAYTFATNVMDVAAVKTLLDEYCEVGGVTYRNRALTAADCRFGRAAAALQAVACGCDANATSDPTGACYKSIGSTTRVGIAVACPLVDATLSVPPHTITFATESVPLADRCQNVEFYASPLAAYRSSAPAQRLSTYFSPKSQTRSRRDFEFLNRHDAVVGEVIAEGITLRSNATFYNVTFCLSLGSFENSFPNFDLDRFEFLDLALSPNPSTVVPLEVATSIRNGGYCALVPEVPPNATVVPILRKENWRDVKKPGLTRGEKTVLALVAAAYFICAIAYGPYYCLSFVRINGWRTAVTVSLFWLPILLGVSNVLRGIYFALLGSGVLANSTYVDVLLVELPTFIWFTATLLMVLFWIVLLASIWDQTARIRRLKRAFWITFIIANALMYALFIAFVVVFSQLDETVEKEKCSGRLQSDIVRRPKRIAFIVYQSFLAGITILLALAYLIGGLLLGRKLRAVRVEEANRKNTKQIWRLVLVACVVSVAVALHALFIFLLAITQPGIPYLALVLLVLDVVPSAVLMWSLPSPTTEISTTSGSRSSGLQSRQSVISEL